MIIHTLNALIGKLRLVISFMINKRKYKEWHLRSQIINPFRIRPQFISVGDNVLVLDFARIEGITHFNDRFFTPQIELCDGVSIQQGIHLTCAESVRIGKNTAVAAYVTITDIHHPYTDINIPIEQQDVEVRPVSIGENCKIYNGAVILPGVCIGNHVTIGANSVVTHDIPDYSVAVGIPARVVKRYDFEQNKWIKV